MQKIKVLIYYFSFILEAFALYQYVFYLLKTTTLAVEKKVGYLSTSSISSIACMTLTSANSDVRRDIKY
jgi:hypothetical protein